MASMKTKVEELPENRVRLDVEVPEADLQHAFEHAASDLAESLRLPGFRKGKAPLPVVVARVGKEAIWQEALSSHLDAWFWSAAADSGITPVANPEVEFADFLFQLLVGRVIAQQVLFLSQRERGERIVGGDLEMVDEHRGADDSQEDCAYRNHPGQAPLRVVGQGHADAFPAAPADTD